MAASSTTARCERPALFTCVVCVLRDVELMLSAGVCHIIGASVTRMSMA